MNYPLKNYIITQRFGETITDPQGHTGIDLWQPIGTPVYTVEGGDVLAAGVINNAYGNTQYGKCVLIDHRNGYYTFYAHLDTITVKKGMSILAGTQIGTVGATGNVTGPHLHFEVRTKPNWNRANFVNPEQFLNFTDRPNIINTPNMPNITKPNELQGAKEAKICAELVNMRDTPGYSSNIITQLKEGVKLKITGDKITKDGINWYPVELNGYVAESDRYQKLLERIF